MLLKIARVMIAMILPIKSLTLNRDLPHPIAALLRLKRVEVNALVLQLLGDSINIEIQVVLQEFADLRVLVIADQSLSDLGIARVDVNIGGRVAVSGPACLCSSTDHVGECVRSEIGHLQEGLDLVVTGISDTHFVADNGSDV